MDTPNDYSIIVYKQDKRTKQGEREHFRKDYQGWSKHIVERLAQDIFPASKGFRIEFHETYVTRKNLLTGKEYRERFDTPLSCSPSSETYWSM